MGYINNLSCPICPETWHVYDIRDNEKENSPLDNPIGVCEHCGSHTDGKEWRSSCSSCFVPVENGKLTGLFVPHLCESCEKQIAENEISKGWVCYRCRAPYSRCSC